MLSKVLLVLLSLSSVTFAQDLRGFKEFIDDSVNPCDDFYAYACGKWTSQNLQAEDVINDQRQENRNLLKSYYRSLHFNCTEDEHPPSKFYYLCLNSKAQSEQEVISNYMRTLFKFSEWPYLNETFNGSSFDWLQVAAHLRHYQVNTLFRISVHRNWMKSEQNHHVIYLTSLKKPFEGSADGDEAFVYKTYVKYLLLAFGVRVRKANEYAQDVVDFEYELDNLSRNIDNKLIYPISIDKLDEQFSGLNWKKYFETLLNVVGKHSDNLLSPLIVFQVDLLKKIEKLLVKTKPETIALYQLTKFLLHYQVKMDPPTWMDCIDEVGEKMPLSVANDFEQFTSKDDKVLEIFYNLQEEFISQINKTTWYSAKTKAEIIEKLEDLGINIGISNVGIQLQPEIEIDQQNYQQARMAFDKLEAKNEFNQLYFYNKLASPNLKPLKVNAYYKMSTNALEIPIGLLRAPLYRENSSLAEIMGSVGSILAHELIHSLDYTGQNYDNKGNVKLDVKPRDIIEFGMRADCFIDQYRGEKPEGLSEDVADSEGLRLAYRAYEAVKDKQQPEIGSKFSGTKLFFLSYAQIWCQAKGSSIQAKNHSPNRDRVNNVVSNSEKFVEAFACPKYSKLNTDKKCQVW